MGSGRQADSETEQRHRGRPRDGATTSGSAEVTEAEAGVRACVRAFVVGSSRGWTRRRDRDWTAPWAGEGSRGSRQRLGLDAQRVVVVQVRPEQPPQLGRGVGSLAGREC
jgi:hypothetical protein